MNHSTLRRHRFGLGDIDESLLRAMRLSYRRHAFRLSTVRHREGEDGLSGNSPPHALHSSALTVESQRARS